MPSEKDLEPLLAEPREDLGVEYKSWLDLSTNEHRATLAKAAIALANHGGGFLVIGMPEGDDGKPGSVPAADDLPAISQDSVNAAIRRYADPEFHVSVYFVTHPGNEIVHPVVQIPSTLTEPVISKRDCEGVIARAKCYIRKPGPRSEEPTTPEEWRTLLNRCVRAGREDMLEAIRSIVSGKVEQKKSDEDSQEELKEFCETAKEYWQELVSYLPEDAPQRFPHGAYEMGFKISSSDPANDLNELQDRLRQARQIRLTGWPPFLDMATPEWRSYPHEKFIEAWVGRPAKNRAERTPAHSDFWRASKNGELYTIRGYIEDESNRVAPGTSFDISIPVWRLGEAALFAGRITDQFGDVDSISIWCRFTGLNGRALISLSGNRLVWGDDISRSDEIICEIQVSPSQLRDNLVEVLHELLVPLYERFDFFRLRPQLVEEELARMMRGM